MNPPQETGIDILYGLKYDIAAALDAGKSVNPILDEAAQALLQLFEKEAVVLEVVVHLSPDTEFVKVIELSKLRELLGGAK